MVKTQKKYVLSDLMIYRPADDEMDMNNVQLLQDEMYRRKMKVDVVKGQVMEH